MRTTLLVACLLYGGTLANSNVQSWLDEIQPKPDRMQGDDPSNKGGIERQVQSLLQAMQGSVADLANMRSGWLDRYDVIAKEASKNSEMTEELLAISKVAMPIIWTASIASKLRDRAMNIKKGGEVIYNPPFTLPITHPLRFLPTRLTDRDEFKVEVGLLLKQEANVGIRLMFEPEHERDFDWDNDDIFVGVHLRWHFAYGPSREISVHEKYNGQFQPGETITPEAHWPDLKVGEKFLVIIVKGKECFEVYTVLGKDIYAQFYIEKPYMHRFCPLPRRENRMLSDPKKLRVVVNEDNPYSGDVQVDSITWFPTNR